MQIDCAIPAPTDRNPERRITEDMADAIDKMEVGQSVFVADFETARCIAARIRWRGRKPKRRIVAGGFRVWRVV